MSTTPRRKFDEQSETTFVDTPPLITPSESLATDRWLLGLSDLERKEYVQQLADWENEGGAAARRGETDWLQ